jgi:hypothetical protein
MKVRISFSQNPFSRLPTKGYGRRTAKHKRSTGNSSRTNNSIKINKKEEYGN